MKAIKVIVLALVFCFFLVGQAQAQFVVKKVKCADAADIQFSPWPDNIPYHRQLTGGTKNLAIQIIRDTCRPRNGGYFRAEVRTNGGTVEASRLMFRIPKNYPASVIVQIEDGRFGFVEFDPQTSGRVSGTFDYMYSWE